MLSELHSLNLKLCSKQSNKKIVLHLIVVLQLSSGWRLKYSTKTREAGWANEQSMHSFMSMAVINYQIPVDLLKPLKTFLREISNRFQTNLTDVNEIKKYLKSKNNFLKKILNQDKSAASFYGAMTLSIMTFSIMTLSIMGLVTTLSIDIQHNSFECHYAECRYAECRD
jgi:hypothetical protein